MDNTKPIARLRMLVSAYDRKYVCKNLDISESYLCDILKGRREISERVGESLGFKAVWVDKNYGND